MNPDKMATNPRQFFVHADGSNGSIRDFTLNISVKDVKNQQITACVQEIINNEEDITDPVTIDEVVGNLVTYHIGSKKVKTVTAGKTNFTIQLIKTSNKAKVETERASWKEIYNQVKED